MRDMQIQLSGIIKSLRGGNIDATGDITVSASSTSYTLESPFLHANSVVLVVALNADGKALLSGGYYISGQTFDRSTGLGTAVINFNSATGSPSLRWAAIG